MLVGMPSTITTPLKNGACGEIKDPTPFLDIMPNGTVVVDFPLTPSASTSKWWHCPSKWLIPIAGPDIDVGEDESVVKEDVIEEKV